MQILFLRNILRGAMLRRTLRFGVLFGCTTSHCTRLRRTSAMDRDGNDFRQTFQRERVIGAESIRFRREHFQKPDDGIVPANRNRDHGTNAKHAAALTIHVRIGFGIVAAQQLAAAHALSGKTCANAEPRSRPWSVLAGAGAANHACAFSQSNRRTRCTSESLRSLRQQLQSSIKVGAERIDFALDRSQSRQNGGIVSRSRGLELLPHPIEQCTVFRLLLNHALGRDCGELIRE